MIYYPVYKLFITSLPCCRNHVCLARLLADTILYYRLCNVSLTFIFTASPILTMKAKSESERRLRDALAKIAEVATAAAQDNNGSDNGTSADNGNGNGNGVKPSEMVCNSIKSLPARLRDKAAEVAIEVNPANAPSTGSITGPEAESMPNKAFLTLLVSKYWGPSPRTLTVSFIEPATPINLRLKILSHMNAWGKTIGISFALTNGVGQVRISLKGSGYWSYLGTDILLIPKTQPTMNLQGFSLTTPDSEYKRVVRHETGHTLGFPHEHMRKEIIARIDPQKAYAYFWTTYGWPKATVDAQVLTPLKANEIVGTAPDQQSIMCYQLPGSITKDGKPILGGLDIDALDYAFAGKLYPKPGSSPTPNQSDVAQQNDDWSESEDVSDDEIQASIQASLSTTDDSTDRDFDYADATADAVA